MTIVCDGVIVCDLVCDGVIVCDLVCDGVIVCDGVVQSGLSNVRSLRTCVCMIVYLYDYI